MNVALWIVAIVLAIAFAATGGAKLLQSKEKLQPRMAWVEDFPAGTIRLIGLAEVLGAIGLVLPAALDIAPILTPIAATCLAIEQALAIVVHSRRNEKPLIALNIMLLALSAFVAVMRFGPYAF